MITPPKQTLLLRVSRVLIGALLSFAAGLVIAAALVTLSNQSLPIMMLQDEVLAHQLNDPEGYASFSYEMLVTAGKAATYMVLVFWFLQLPRYFMQKKANKN